MVRSAIHPGEHLAAQLGGLGLSAAELGRPVAATDTLSRLNRHVHALRLRPSAQGRHAESRREARLTAAIADGPTDNGSAS